MDKTTLRIYHSDIDAAQNVGYGIEEEGLPYEIISSDTPEEDAVRDVSSGGFGVSVSVGRSGIGIYYDGHRGEGPFVTADVSSGKRAGQNAARIVKQKPLDL